jgi:hypothetical protein
LRLSRDGLGKAERVTTVRLALRLILAGLIASVGLLGAAVLGSGAEPAAQLVDQGLNGEAQVPLNCSPAYPDFCIPPPPPDLDCGDIPYSDFTVLAPDPHALDGPDNNGRGCDASGKPRFEPGKSPPATTSRGSTTSAAPAQGPTTTAAPAATTSTSKPATTATTVAPTTATTVAGMPHTGTKTDRQLGAALLLVACGAVMLVVGATRPKLGMG